MKILTTMVSDHIGRNNERAVIFSKRYVDLPTSFKKIISAEGGLTENNLRVWFTSDSMIAVSAEDWSNRDNGLEIKFSVLLFMTPVELALREIGIDSARPVELDLTLLCKQLVNTYFSLGVTNWVDEGMPIGIRSIVAFRYGYDMSTEFNNMLTEAMKIVDETITGDYK